VTIAYIALFGWFLVTLGLFLMLRPPTAAALSLVGASMFLPSAVSLNPPILPVLAKEEFASIALALAVSLFARPALRRARLGRGPELLLGVGFVGGILGVMSNSDPLRVGPVLVPGTFASEAVADVLELAIRWGVPFCVGRALFRRARDVRVLFSVLALAGLVYSLPILLELWISPQLHRMVYGYHQHAFLQTMRGGGYRPMVFMAHGLALSLFVVMCMASASALARMRQRAFGLPAAAIAGYLALILVVCKSTGSLVYGIFLGPLVLLASPRLQVRAACVLAVLILSYPLLRAYDVVPGERGVALAGDVAGAQRAATLAARRETATAMLERIAERPWLGWVSAGRSGIRDPETGELETVYDGVWVILLAERGIAGFVAVFGLLLFPLLAAARGMSRIRSASDRVVVGALSLMVAVRVFDLLPNSTVEGYLTLLSGALAGVVPGILREQQRERARRRRPEPRGAPIASPPA
jgi:O-antigen ligase